MSLILREAPINENYLLFIKVNNYIDLDKDFVYTMLLLVKLVKRNLLKVTG